MANLGIQFLVAGMGGCIPKKSNKYNSTTYRRFLLAALVFVDVHSNLEVYIGHILGHIWNICTRAFIPKHTHLTSTSTCQINRNQ